MYLVANFFGYWSGGHFGIAETNTDIELKNLYQIPNYTSYYQTKIEGKAKGTGVALYVNNNFNAEILEEFSYCTTDFESLFVRLTHPSGSKTIVTGVIYRPPSGNVNIFLDKFEQISLTLPESGVCILGDFNIDLLKIKDNVTVPSQFESHFMSNGFTPVISIPTHSRANCKPSCIDNILTNDTNKTLLSGCIKDQIGDHLPIFEFTNIELGAQMSKNEKCVKYYDFSNENLDKLNIILENSLGSLGPTVSNNFSDFTDLFNKALDFTCKLEKPKVTKRTPLNNPWITDSLITAIDKKHELKGKWTKPLIRNCLRATYSCTKNVQPTVEC